MTTSSAYESSPPNNRRECFRITDRIGLRVVVLNENEFFRAQAKAFHLSERQQLLNSMIVSSANRSASLRSIHEELPEIADFLSAMDQKIVTLANLMTQEDSDAPVVQTHDVNLSASGLRFYSDEGYPADARLELHIHLFPTDTCLQLYGTVVRCERGPRYGICAGRMAVAVTYFNMPDNDREILFRHIHSLQLDSVRRNIPTPTV